MNTINQRISFIINELFKGNASAFCRVVNVKQSTMNTILGTRQSKPSYEVINAIALSDLNISSDWLLTGRGSMMKTNTSEKNSNLEINDTTIVYHYTTLKGLFGIIGNQCLRFSELKNSNDLREISNPCGYKYLCFCMDGDENKGYEKPRMWAQYGGGNYGVCIGFKLEQLIKQATLSQCEIKHFPIKYVNKNELFHVGYKSEEALEYKAKDWSSENEYRFITKDANCLPITYDIIDKIYVGENVPSTFEPICKIGLNNKIRAYREKKDDKIVFPIYDRIVQKIEFNKDILMNGITGELGIIKSRENVDANIGISNAQHYFQQMGSMEHYIRVQSEQYEKVIRENERLKIELDKLIGK